MTIRLKWKKVRKTRKHFSETSLLQNGRVALHPIHSSQGENLIVGGIQNVNDPGAFIACRLIRN